ncbi:SWEET sugar transporter [Sesbania bispinosa]|nr:SWEET sugar transporter [Sesbania bispinosa]
MDIAHFLFGIFGNASGLFLFLAPTITFRRIVSKKSTEEFSGIPYVMCLLNCLLSAWYGLPFVSPHNILVTIINGAGAVIEVVYVFIFIFFSPKKEKAKILGLFTFVTTVFSAVVFVSLFALHGNSRKIFCGFAAAIFSIIMYGSPLSIMRLVIKTKSVEFMPFFLSLFVFLCGTSWFIFGLLGHDPFVAVPNGVGSALGTMQLILYFIYRGNKGDTKKPTTQEESMEMGTAKPPSSKGAIQSNDPDGGVPQRDKIPNLFTLSILAVWKRWGQEKLEKSEHPTSHK